MRVLIYNELNPAKVPGLAKVQAALEAGHFALEQALIDPKYARERLGRIYPMLTPDNIAIQAEGRLMPLDQRLMEFFLLHLCSTLFYRYLGPALAMPRGGDAFTAPMLAHCVAHLPDSVLPTDVSNALISAVFGTMSCLT